MKQAIKKATATLLVTALALSASQTTQAASPKIKKERMGKYDEGPCAYFKFPNNPERDWIYLGKSIQARMVVPSGAKIKSVRLTSSNQKVIKITNSKTFRLKGVKTGRSKLTVKVVWTYSGRLKKPNYILKWPNYNYRSATKKSGKTYTTLASYTITVFKK